MGFFRNLMLLQPSAKHIFIIITMITIHYYVLSACYAIGILYIIWVPAMSLVFYILFVLNLKTGKPSGGGTAPSLCPALSLGQAT